MLLTLLCFIVGVYAVAGLIEADARVDVVMKSCGGGHGGGDGGGALLWWQG